VIASALEQYRWDPQPLAESLILDLQQQLLSASPAAARLADAMRDQTATRFLDWVDHFEAPSSDWREKLLLEGFRIDQFGAAYHPGAQFPRVLLKPEGALEATVKVESVEDFLSATNANADIKGAKGGSWRYASVFPGLNVMERHGARGFVDPTNSAGQIAAAAKHLQSFRDRDRSDQSGFGDAETRIDGAIAEIGRDWACDLFFKAEREYWQARNTAAQVQKARQDRLGLGWANHDHHTYRSSREAFPKLIAVLEKLGFFCRERFYAGLEANWGAQVLEQPITGIVIFADVDMSPEELAGDFSHLGFTEKRHKLGTIGLWCRLHGEAFLEAGMHHLEAQFDFKLLKEQLAREGVTMMAPFTNFEYLTQCFTAGERWSVKPERIAALLAEGHITAEQADRFRQEGAVGSHLENLERNQGYKGFNQTGVSDIISRTDPRRL
jgi:hypothetical protein